MQNHQMTKVQITKIQTTRRIVKINTDWLQTPVMMMRITSIQTQVKDTIKLELTQATIVM